MVSMYPNSKAWDFTFLQYLDKDDNKKENLVPKKVNDASILSFIQNNKEFSIFSEIVRIAEMEHDLHCRLIHITLLLPRDTEISKSIDLLKLDKLEARKIVMLSILPEIIRERDFITGLFDTYLRNFQVWYDNGVVNKRAKIIKYDINRANGVIHILDNFTFGKITPKN